MRARPGPCTAADDDLDAALAELFECHVDALFGFVLGRCGSRQVAEDVVSETFVDATRAHQAGRAGEVTRGWLVDVARKRLIDHWRRSARERARAERLGRLGGLSEVAADHPESDPDVAAALDLLPERQRAALVLRYLDGFGVDEVAHALDASYAATESLLARGRRAFLAAYERTSS